MDVYLTIQNDSLKQASEDPTNLHRHARHNAQEAVAQARERAQQFDVQAALERKTNEALKLAKAQAHIHEDGGAEESTAGPSKAPLVDCKFNSVSLKL